MRPLIGDMHSNRVTHLKITLTLNPSGNATPVPSMLHEGPAFPWIMRIDHASRVDAGPVFEVDRKSEPAGELQTTGRRQQRQVRNARQHEICTQPSWRQAFELHVGRNRFQFFA